jgi:HAD superfamily hydrolase (TIGR01509 family)
MTTRTACLVDVYDTVLSVDMARYGGALAAEAGVDPGDFASVLSRHAEPVTDGRLTIAQALAEAMTDLGVGTADGVVDRLVATDRELLREVTTLHPDTVPFLESLRAKGVRTAFVSNCADNTRPHLDAYGLSGLVDHLVLSCEVGVAKPDPAIFEIALARLGVAAQDALFVDDQQRFCDAASGLGIRAVRIDRFDGLGEVSTLTELGSYFW